MKKLFPVLVVLLILAAGIFWVGSRVANAPKDTATTIPKAFNKSRYPINKPGSVWWIVNKTRPARATYVPKDLIVPNVAIRPTAGTDERQVSQKIAPAMQAMFAAAQKDGLQLMLASGYRSYQLQATVYDQNVQSLGQTEADRVSAKAGTSEHQTGLSFDIEPASRTCEIQECFGTTPEGKWVAKNAYKYGFIIRYAKGKQKVTGYNYEPWHLRFVGKPLATEMRRQRVLTLEEFFDL